MLISPGKDLPGFSHEVTKELATFFEKNREEKYQREKKKAISVNKTKQTVTVGSDGSRHIEINTEKAGTKMDRTLSKRYFISDRSHNADIEDTVNISESIEDQVSVTLELDHIIDELIRTEKKYISYLQVVVEKYLPLNFSGKQPHIFGNIHDIYVEAQNMLFLLQKKSTSVDKIAHVFINKEDTFSKLYPKYALARATSEVLLKEFTDVIKAKDNELNDNVGLTTYLTAPLTRLVQYKNLMERMQTQMKKSNYCSDSVGFACDKIKRLIEKTDEIIAVGAIKYKDMDLGIQDSFIMQEEFNVLKPKRCKSTIFLFENAIVFTENLSKNENRFEFLHSIKLKDLCIETMAHEQHIFYLKDYSNKKVNGEIITYLIEASTQEIKNKWTKEIESMLWKQVKIAKEQQRLHSSDF